MSKIDLEQSAKNLDNSIRQHSSNLSQPQSFSSDSDEINLLEYLYVLVKNKWWIIGALVLGLVVGYVAAIIKGPTYIAEAEIAAKEDENKSTPNLSSFGAFSGIVASQLNIGGNPGLDKIDLILGSRKFSAEMIEKYNLFTPVMKNSSPKTYNKMFDTVRNEWKKEFKKPNLLIVGAGVKVKFLKKEINKNNTMTLKIESKDSTFSDTLLSKYLQYLNIYIQTSVRSEARENVSYLENQLITISDPLLREKLQSKIANELEKEMVVSKDAFKIIDPPFRNINFKAKKLYMMIFGAGFTFLFVIYIIIIKALNGAIKTKEDIELINKIKKNLFI